MGKVYPVGLVGESKYQAAIRKIRAGQSVQLVLEPDNPHDKKAIAVVASNGDTLGYISKDSFVRDLVHAQGQWPTARIKSIDKGPSGALGVVIDVDKDGDKPPPSRAFAAPTKSATRSKTKAAAKVDAKVYSAIAIVLLLIIGKCVS